MSTKAHTPINEIPQWVRDYNANNYQSSAGKAVKISLESVDQLKAQNQELITRLYNLVNALDTDLTGVALRIHEARETLKKVI